VVEPYPSEKYDFVSWDDYSQYMEKLIKIHENPLNHYNPSLPTECKVINFMFQTTNQLLSNLGAD